ncbi:MAG TPA: hypothetical protein VF572_03455 [Candidatus Saccharimonadales bacterium]|jgi:hypothetical protein
MKNVTNRFWNSMKTCDRGGRLYGLAVHAAWRETRDGKPFPTVDSKVHFARISKTEDPEVLQGKIDQIVEGSLRAATGRGKELDEGEELKV